MLGVENKTALEKGIGLLYSPTPFELSPSGRLLDPSTGGNGRHLAESVRGTVCFITTCSLPALFVEPGMEGRWTVDLEPGYYAVVVLANTGGVQGLGIDSSYKPAIITVLNK